MNMRMMLESLIPCVEDAEKSDLRAEVFRITGDFKQRLRAGPEQQIIDFALVLQREL